MASGYNSDYDSGMNKMTEKLSMSSFMEAYGGLLDKHSEANDFIRMAWLDTPMGPILAGADSTALRFLEFAQRRSIDAQIASLRLTSRLSLVMGECAVLEHLRIELSDYFSGRLKDFSLPVKAPGTDFQTRVWSALREIPYGKTWSYGELATSIGSPGASRAVGAANGVNRIALVIPCHRVINADGKLGGYAAGLERKRALLNLEAAHR